MPIRCVCPNGHALRVKDKLAGQTGVCPTCQAEFAVPSLAEPAATPSSAGTSPPPLPAGSPEASLEAVEWRVALADGQQFGPTVPMIFAQWIVAGRVTPDALVWRTGWPEWRRADQAAAELPAPLPQTPESPAAPPLPEVPASATLPPQAATPVVDAPAPREPEPKPSGGSYQLRKQRQTRRRRNFTIGLAVVCFALAAMLVMLMMSGPPAGAPVIPQ
ncbi:hypothetical protein MalM25_35140 [Planctomycetes bacterium MalM25]|nr:hypothetical protein MalM25_35140 [Planctomycetes bacterium MalM25]